MTTRAASTSRGNGTISRSVTDDTALDFGVLFYNTQIEGRRSGRSPQRGVSRHRLYPLKLDTIRDGLVLFKDCPDRTVECGMGPTTLGDDVTLNGSDSDMMIRGTIYVPEGDVKVNGSVERSPWTSSSPGDSRQRRHWEHHPGAG